MEQTLKQTLRGEIRDLNYDELTLMLRLANNIDIEVKYHSELEDVVNTLWEGMHIEVDAEITGWKSMAYPHLGYDVMEGIATAIKDLE